MKSILSFFAIPSVLACIIALLVMVEPEKIEPIAQYFGISNASVPNCSDVRTADVLFEIFSNTVDKSKGLSWTPGTPNYDALLCNIMNNGAYCPLSSDNVSSDAIHLSKDDFHLIGITTISSDNQDGRIYPTKFVCQAYLNINLPSAALRSIAGLKKAIDRQPLLTELSSTMAAVNIEGDHVSQLFQYTTQMDDALTYQSVSAEGLNPVAALIASLYANGISMATKNKPEELSPQIATNLKTNQSQLTIADSDKLWRQIEQCWNAPIGIKNVDDLSVEIMINVNPDQTVASTDIVDKKRYNSDAFFRAAADAAIHAIHNTKCSPLELPADKYDGWKRIDLIFDPKDILSDREEKENTNP